MRAMHVLPIVLAALALPGCTARRPAEGSDPEAPAVFVYLDALPAEAAALQAELGSVRLVDEEGTARSLELTLTRLDGAADRRQRLLAWGLVPAGSYRGLAVEVRTATLRGGSGPGALQLP